MTKPAFSLTGYYRVYEQKKSNIRWMPWTFSHCNTCLHLTWPGFTTSHVTLGSSVDILAASCRSGHSRTFPSWKGMNTWLVAVATAGSQSTLRITSSGRSTVRCIVALMHPKVFLLDREGQAASHIGNWDQQAPLNAASSKGTSTLCLRPCVVMLSP